MARSSRSMPRSAAARRSALALLLALACPCALAKVEQGTLKIDSVTTEQLIGKFGVAESGDVQLKLTTSRDGWERGRHELHVLFFHDDNYRKWEKAIQAGSLCRDRNKMADIEHKVDLPHELATHHGHGWEYFVDPETGKSYRVSLDTGESEWNSPHNATRMREEGPVNRITHRETVFSTKLEHTYPIRGRNSKGERVLKAAHWYVVVSDCALEFYEAHPPPMHYELTMFNGGSHLPSDLNGMGVLYFFLLLAMVLGAGPAFASASNQYRRLGRVHALVALLFAAYAAQTMSFFLELWHLSVFARDGKGLQWRYTFLAADFAAEVSQGFSEFIVAALLLFLACGWTTVSFGSVGARLLNSLESGGAEVSEEPTRAAAGNRASSARRAGKDFKEGVVAVVKTALHLDEDNPEVKRRVASVTRALQQPARLVGVASTGAARVSDFAGATISSSTIAGVAKGVDAGGAFLFAFAFATAYLEMASRRFTDDFSAFHDHEHWPGYCLVALRLCLLVLFLVGGRVTIAAAESRDPEAAAFLKKLRQVGGFWLAAFPFLVCTAWCAPAYFRHRYVVGGLALLQTAAILGLAYLCLGSERFLALSTVAPRSASAAGSVAGTRGIASKLAVD
mmetsp:Transcript_762/g.2963  ORF Transcript_762/g.2963 Transcript_762/m.2963 type:complete len:623 (-) Transcript_762:202-2070(-)